MDSKKLWIVGGLAAASGLGLLTYYLSDDGKSASEAPEQRLTRDQVVAVLKDMAKEMNSPFITLASFANSIKEQVGNQVPDAEIKELLSTQSPISGQMRRAEMKVYQKHGTDEKSFKYACEVLYRGDPEIKSLMESMKTNMDNAYKGVAPQISSTLPDYITPDLVIKILKEMYDATLYTTYKKVAELKAMGIQPSPYSESFMKATQQMEADGEAAKYKIFEKYGLTKHEEPAGILLHNAIQKFKNDGGFMQKMVVVEQEFSQNMQKIMQDSLPEDEKERLNKIYEEGPLIEEVKDPMIENPVDNTPEEEVILNEPKVQEITEETVEEQKPPKAEQQEVISDQEAPKAEEQKKPEAPKAEEQKKPEAPKTEEQKKPEAPKTEEQKKPETPKVEEQKKPETPKVEEQKKPEAPKTEEQKKPETPKAEKPQESKESKESQKTQQ